MPAAVALPILSKELRESSANGPTVRPGTMKRSTNEVAFELGHDARSPGAGGGSQEPGHPVEGGGVASGRGDGWARSVLMVGRSRV